MTLPHLPKVLRETRFTDEGMAKTRNGLLVPVYVGSQKGFNEPGRRFLKKFYGELRERKVLALCPFSACAEYLDPKVFEERQSVRQQLRRWGEFNERVGQVNYETLMPRAKFMIALYDGGHPVDDGLAAEVAIFSERHGPVVGIRTDFRLAENPAAPINPAIAYFHEQGKHPGTLHTGSDAMDWALEDIAQRARTLLHR